MVAVATVVVAVDVAIHDDDNRFDSGMTISSNVAVNGAVYGCVDERSVR